MTGRKVLVLGDDTRSFLAISRSLGRRGIAVHAAPASFIAPALASRYIARVHYLPFWMGDGAEWLAAMESLLAAERFDLIIPCNETTLLPIRRNRARLEQLTRLAIPDDRAIEALFDKHDTRELARSLGIATAPGRLPAAGDTAEGLLAELGAPVVVKPRRSYFDEELGSRGRVQIIDTAAELAAVLPHLDPRTSLYEGFFPGIGVGVSVLAHQGRVLQAFEHHRVHENGAGSFYRVSAALTPALERACADMVAAVAYTGVAMFEFRVAPDGAWILLEVNARPWGSMPLPVGLGVDFPHRWFQLLVEGVETPAVAYPVGIYGRNLVPDFWNTLSEVRQAPGGPMGKIGLLLRRSAELGRVVTGHEIHDVMVRDDLRPGLRELALQAEGVGLRIWRRLPGTAALRRAATQRALGRALRVAGDGALRVAFVCQGNICRSPFAAALLRARLAGQAVEVSSFGMMPRPGRPTPDLGIAVAAEMGIDLAPHRSAHLSRAAAERAHVILVFDEINTRAVRSRYPDLAVPVLPLGDFAPQPMERIADPIDGDRSVYVSIYGRIAGAVDGLAARLRSRRR